MTHLFSCMLFCSLVVTARCTSSEEKRFIVVSDYDMARNFYPRIRITKPRFRNEPNIDLDTKERICKDVVGSRLFRQKKEYPYEEPNTGCLLWLMGRYPYPTKLLEVTNFGTPELSREYAFECLMQSLEGLKKIYISEEYNLVDDDDDAEDAYIAARFIFKESKILETTNLFGLAEVASTPVTTFPDYNVEHIYLRRRRKYRLSWHPRDDPLCGLTLEEKSRICDATFGSNYFKETIAPLLSPGNDKKITGRCQLKSVSFQTEYGKAIASGGHFREWMLNCWPLWPFKYFLSHAYQSNQVFVYFWDTVNDDVFLENLSVDVRLKVNFLKMVTLNDPSSLKS